MTIALEVRLRDLAVWRVFRTEGMPLDTDNCAFVVVHLPIASVLRGRLCPRHQLVPVSAHQLLTFSDVHTRDRRHRGIVCTALNVLSQRVETMVVVVPFDVGAFASY